jgi:hypothetical protein
MMVIYHEGHEAREKCRETIFIVLSIVYLFVLFVFFVVCN